jgi:hypothetical protein
VRRPGARAVASFLRRLRQACGSGRVYLTRKAAGEAVEGLGWDAPAIVSFLGSLSAAAFRRTERSVLRREDLVWVFAPWAEIRTPGGERELFRLWVRLVEREGFWVVSFHEA